jgi:murein L,D-transpeptidase YafK
MKSLSSGQGSGRTVAQGAAFFDSFGPSEALTVKHRKWARFLGLSVASAASLCLGAFLSYEAALQQDPANHVPAGHVSAAQSPADQAPAANHDLPAPQKLAAVIPDPAPIARPARPGGAIVASLEPAAPPVFSPDTALNLPADLRTDDVAEVIQASLPAQSGPLPAESEQSAANDDETDGKPVPLPPARPTSLNAGGPIQTEAALAPPPANLPAPPPVPGQGPAPALSAPSQAPVPASSPVAAQPANSGFANALAAITSSVGGANSAFSPTETEPPPPEVASGGFKMGSPVYIRIFKKESLLELWIKRGDSYALYKTFPVCRWSGGLGPKEHFADRQAPEGFYEVSAHQLNPHSHYHLALNLGYPNAFDRRHGATGDAVMIHGDCKSVGCFAMTDAGIDQIYPIVAAALREGEREVPVHIFPFRMTDQAIARESAPTSALLSFLSQENARPHRDWSAFWRNLKEGYDLFERSHVPPTAYACGDRYEFGDAGRACTRIAGW